jgi:hypothetical protein
MSTLRYRRISGQLPFSWQLTKSYDLGGGSAEKAAALDRLRPSAAGWCVHRRCMRSCVGLGLPCPNDGVIGMIAPR